VLQIKKALGVYRGKQKQEASSLPQSGRELVSQSTASAAMLQFGLAATRCGESLRKTSRKNGVLGV
jgi:hypothetical protein